MANPLTTLTPNQCLSALAGGSVGRIAVTSHALPAIVPVSYVLDGSSVVFRTRTDGMLARACDGNVVAFEVDRLAGDGRSGWSVLVVGVAALLSGSDALRALELKLVSAAGDELDQFVSVAIGRISGRRIGGVGLSDKDDANAPAEGDELGLASYP